MVAFIPFHFSFSIWGPGATFVVLDGRALGAWRE